MYQPDANSKFTILTCVENSKKTGGGVSDVALQLHKNFLANNISAILISGSHTNLLPYQYDAGLKAEKLKDFKLKKEENYIIHIHGLWTPFVFLVYLFAKKNKIKLIISPHGMLEPWAMNHKFWKKKLAWVLYQKKILKDADLIIVNSQKEEKAVSCIGLRIPVVVINNGVDVTHIPKSFLPAPSNKTVMFLSRLSPVKGLPDLIEAWSLLPINHGYTLKIYGHADAGYENELKDLIKTFNVKNSVSIEGPVFEEEKWIAYDHASIFILPSYSENFGIVVAEALWVGTPVITTFATPWDCLTNEGIGWQVENDSLQIRDVLTKAMSLGDSELIEMGKKASKYSKDQFNWSEIINHYVNSYHWVLGNRSKKINNLNSYKY
ncbi:MAG: glycosyltransferase [Colwelliaceae bacterium]|nr:glycosyltransferase [Colwelliaceae bacterium]